MADPYNDTGQIIVRAFIRGWNAALKRWLPVAVDAEGAVSVTGPSGEPVAVSLGNEAPIVGTDTPVDVATVSTGALPANNGRRYALFINDSDATIWISTTGAAAVVNEGIRLSAAGGNYEMASQYGNLEQAAVYAIHEAIGTKRLLVKEGM